MDKLTERLETQGWALTDGATGTNLFNAGLEAGEAPEIWNLEKPNEIKNLYQSAVDAGSDLFLTNSFGGNAARLKLHNAQDRAYEISKIAAELGREVADKSPSRPIVAGSMGPTGEIMGPAGDLDHATAVEIFHQQAEGLVAGGADILWVETISAPEEYLAAAEAIARVDVPWVGTMSFDTAGRTMMGVTSAQMVALVNGISNRPVGFGANCGVGASDLLRSVLGMKDAGATVPIVAKGNAGIPKYVDGHIHYDGTPDLMADYAVLARDCGAAIIGGCCGTMPEHLRAMRSALEENQRADPPKLADIEARIGPFSSASDGTEANQTPQRTRRRRRAAR